MGRGRAYSLDFRLGMMKQHTQGRSFAALSRETDVSRDVLRRWWQRYEVGGIAALHPRSRRPRRSPTQVPATTEAAILALRTQDWGARIALQVAPSVSTVYRTLVRHGRQQLQPPRPRVVQRYEKTRPGDSCMST